MFLVLAFELLMNPEKFILFISDADEIAKARVFIF